jgi:hypothetical protein
MIPLTFKTVWRNEDHDWSSEGDKISDPQKLETIKFVMETGGPVLVEHWFYCGSRAPDRLIFDDFADFIEHLRLNAKAGDAIHVWDLHSVLRDDNRLVDGKCPAEDGAVPRRGAY